MNKQQLIEALYKKLGQTVTIADMIEMAEQLTEPVAHADERRAFECSCDPKGIALRRHPDLNDQYLSWDMQCKWMGWQARATQSEDKRETDVAKLLEDMRCQVVWSHEATMPIPLYKRIKSVIESLSLNGKKD